MTPKIKSIIEKVLPPFIAGCLVALLKAFGSNLYADKTINYLHLGTSALELSLAFGALWVLYLTCYHRIILWYNSVRHTTATFCNLGSHWRSYIWQGSNIDCMRIRSAIGREYFDEEIRDISGIADLHARGYREKSINGLAKILKYTDSLGNPLEPRPLIVTNFVRYSQLVRTAVDQALEARRTNSRVICLTTLSMSLSKWFNFDAQLKGANPQWDEYLRFLRTLSRTPGVVLARILFIGDGTNDSGLRLELQTEDALKKDLESYIWVEEINIQSQTMRFPKPITNSDRAAYNLTPADNCTGYAYVIESPPSKGHIIKSEGDKAQRGFRRLGREFLAHFHSPISQSSPSDYHAYYSQVECSMFGIREAEPHKPPFPADLFLIGLAESTDGADIQAMPIDDIIKATNPLFCLSAKTDDELEMVHLHLLDSERCKNTLAEIKQYLLNITSVGSGTRKSGKLSTLIDSGSHAVSVS